ncbi:glycosyltransferase [Streptomyces sp. NPDC089919]|uniref:glycosyltransferase n=1 Tax=Streptomyces sp. NPDC089919 TaxID=3155188 RepID=UPI00341E47C8
MKISFLLHNRHGIGGVIQSTLSLAAALAAGHEVTIVSTRRDRDRPALAPDPRVRIIDLVDTREDSAGYDLADPRHREAPAVYPEGDSVRFPQISRLTETRLAAHLARTDADVVIATNPGLAVCLAAMGSRRYVRVAQEHQALAAPDSPLGRRLAGAYRELDAVVTVNPRDERRARQWYGRAGTRVETIGNCVPDPLLAPSDLSSRTVVTAGRLAPVKRFPQLVAAFARVVEERPDWRLRIYGVGPERDRIREAVDAHALADHVFLMGASTRMEAEWAKAALAVSSSHAESFSLVVVEAARAGVPTVSTATDGPASLIEHGTDGLLTPRDAPDALGDALLTLIQDDALRRRMGAAARHIPERFAPAVIAGRYELLLHQLHADRALPEWSDWCVAPDGDVTVRVSAPGTEPADLQLLCVSRGERAADPAVTFPFEPEPGSPAGDFVATIRPSSLPLAEGRWEVYVQSADGRARRRLHTRLCDDRGLLAAARPDCGPPGPAFVSVVPHSGPDGTLDLRVWVRATHAEVAAVELTEEGAVITVGLWPPRDPDRVTVLARPRRDGGPAVALPVRSADGPGLRFALSLRELAQQGGAAHGDWDLYVTGEGFTTARVAGLTGDCADRSAVYRYPPLDLTDTPRGAVRARLYYTADNGLSCEVTEPVAEGVPPVEGRGAAEGSPAGGTRTGRRYGLLRRRTAPAPPQPVPDQDTTRALRQTAEQLVRLADAMAVQPPS